MFSPIGSGRGAVGTVSSERVSVALSCKLLEFETRSLKNYSCDSQTIKQMNNNYGSPKSVVRLGGFARKNSEGILSCNPNRIATFSH